MLQTTGLVSSHRVCLTLSPSAAARWAVRESCLFTWTVIIEVSLLPVFLSSRKASGRVIIKEWEGFLRLINQVEDAVFDWFRGLNQAKLHHKMAD